MTEQWQLWKDGTGTQLARPPGVIRPSVSVVLRNPEGYILLEQRADNGQWALPGGAIEIGESVYTALARELYEETGYLIDTRHLLLAGIYSDPLWYACSTYTDAVVHYVALCFTARYRHTEPPQCSGESLQVGWYGIEALPQPLMPSHALRIRDALRHLATPTLLPVIR